jgi:hypothetical protein
MKARTPKEEGEERIDDSNRRRVLFCDFVTVIGHTFPIRFTRNEAAEVDFHSHTHMRE